MNNLKKLKIIIIVLAVLIVLSIGALYYFGIANVDDIKNKVKRTTTTTTTKPPLTIFDEKSSQRPYGVMIDNVAGAFPQAGVQDAFLTYEITVEGGLTRLFALFKDDNVSKIGPVRSARHYFIDYALENNAIFAHFGYSPQAQYDLRVLKINNLSGTTTDAVIYNRDSSITKSPHNVFTSSTQIVERSSQKYNMNTGYDPLLNYSVEEVSLESYTDKIVANIVRVQYRSALASYSYNATEKVYYRFMNNKAHMDRNYNKQVTVKNIIVVNMDTYALNDGSGKDRQGLYNIGTFTGYYITNGYAIPITCEKASRAAQSVYKDSTGKEIIVNDGNTYIQIQPKSKTTTFE